MPAPSIHANPFIFFTVKKNRILYLSLIENVLNGEDVLLNAKESVKKKELKFWTKGEWDLVSILKRILMYSIFLISLYFSFYIFENFRFIFVLVPLIFTGYFIFWDIMILLTKRDLKNNKN